MIAVEPADLAAVVVALRGRVAVLAPRALFPPRADGFALPDDVAGMARELYGALRSLDAGGFDVIVAALPPAAGLGEAVGDRLRRAAGPRQK